MAGEFVKLEKVYTKQKQYNHLSDYYKLHFCSKVNYPLVIAHLEHT